MSSLADRSASVAPSAAGSDEPAADDPQVLAAVQEYLALLEAGQAPDRDAFVGRHPEVAAVLAECLEGLAFVQAVSPALSNPVAGVAGLSAGGESPTGTLGDFRLIREVGRGGMGIVYEAEQISLGRRVALKVLPFAATMDPRQLQRFHNEARAAAGLHQEHIVPVYAVGQERGVHYYAMQLIDGRTLAEVITGLRTAQPTTACTLPPGAAPPAADTASVAARATSAAPRDAASFRRVAEWGIQAAEALEHAHTLAVVHRDVKPANLMIDSHGKLWVTDFGLARFGADAGLTMTGDVVGTLRYMSPEQALAKHGLVDHRTDVYALGATLYELLTLQPAIDGEDREAILRDIAFAEPRPPRQIEGGIPADLETIVLKALAKEPAERYATAQELAEDLRRWFGDQPIRARRPTVLKRVAQCGRRHRGVVWAGGIGLLLAMVVLTTSSVLLCQETNQVKQALVEGDAQYRRAERQYRRADDNFNHMMSTTVDFLEEVDDADRPDGPSIAELRQSLEDRLEQLLQRCQDSAGTDAVALRDAAWWREDVGRYYLCRGDYAKAEKKYRTALVLYEALAADHPDEATIHYPLSRCLRQLGSIHYTAGRTDEARAWYRRSLTEHRLRLQLDPDWRAHADLALLLATCPLLELRDAKEALRLALRAVELCPEGEDCWYHLGLAHYRNGHWREAVVSLQECVRREREGANVCFFLAMAHHQLGERGHANEYFERGVRWMADKNKLDERAPSIWRYRAEAAELLGIKDTPRGVKTNSPGEKR